MKDLHDLFVIEKHEDVEVDFTFNVFQRSEGAEKPAHVIYNADKERIDSMNLTDNEKRTVKRLNSYWRKFLSRTQKVTQLLLIPQNADAGKYISEEMKNHPAETTAKVIDIAAGDTGGKPLIAGIYYPEGFPEYIFYY